jgi:hypothetical protein
VSARWRRAFGGAVFGALASLAAGCIGENPIDVDARVRVFGLLGGLEVGQALTLEGEQAERIPLPGNATGADYVIVPFLGSDLNATVTVGIQGATLVDAVGSPSGRVSRDAPTFLGHPALGAAAATARFHERLRRWEIEELEPELRSMSPRVAEARSRPASAPAAPAPAVGDVLTLRTINGAAANFCEAPLMRDGRVAAVSSRAIVVSDLASPVQLSDVDLAAVASEFDALVYPVDVEHFGEPSDVDANGRVIIFFTPVVNDREAAGFHFAGDLFSQLDCPASNEAEIVYILSPDPSGQTAVQVSYDAVRRIASGIVAHEVQHLINASRRIYVNNASQLESVWLNEALSHIAEELIFYEATPFGPGQNLDLDDLRSVLDATNRFIAADLFFYASYAADPTAATLTGPVDEPTRGAMWAFLRYAADLEGRPDTEFFHALVNSTTRGLANLNRVLRTGDALDLMQAWTASVFSDDHVDGVPDFLTQPSWNFRSILPVLTDDGAFPLDLQVIQTGGGQVQVALNGGSSAFFRVAVGGLRTGEVKLDVSGSSADALRVTVIRSR